MTVETREGAARIEQGVYIGQVGEGMIAELRDRQLPGHSAAVERFDILHNWLKIKAFRVHFSVEHGIENETVVRAGREAEGDRRQNLQFERKKRKGLKPDQALQT